MAPAVAPSPRWSSASSRTKWIPNVRRTPTHLMQQPPPPSPPPPPRTRAQQPHPDVGAAAASGGEEPPPAPSPGARSGKQSWCQSNLFAWTWIGTCTWIGTGMTPGASDSSQFQPTGQPAWRIKKLQPKGYTYTVQQCTYTVQRFLYILQNVCSLLYIWHQLHKPLMYRFVHCMYTFIWLKTCT